MSVFDRRLPILAVADETAWHVKVRLVMLSPKIKTQI
jgi:hypothetical protein